MKKMILMLIALAIAGNIAGCATRRQVIDLQTQVDAIKADQTAIRQENATLDSLFRNNIEQSRRLNADFSSYTDRLDSRLQAIQARLEDAISLINRGGGSGRPVNPPQGNLPLTDTAGAESTENTGGIDCQKIYNAAYLDFVKESYDMAVKGFKSFLQTCPNSGLSDNAQYWIGESYYVQKNYDRAQPAFQDLVDKYPNSERLAAAKLKLGETLYAQRQRSKARTYFEDVIKNNPGTEEAQEAARMLERYR